MHARITRVNVQPGKINDAIKTYRDIVLTASKQQEGFEDAILLVDRDTSVAISMTFWKSEDAMTDSEISPYYVDQLRKMAQYFAGMPGREGFEIAVFSSRD